MGCSMTYEEDLERLQKQRAKIYQEAQTQIVQLEGAIAYIQGKIKEAEKEAMVEGYKEQV